MNREFLERSLLILSILWIASQIFFKWSRNRTNNVKLP